MGSSRLLGPLRPAPVLGLLPRCTFDAEKSNLSRLICLAILCLQGMAEQVRAAGGNQFPDCLKGRGPTARQVAGPEHSLFQRSPCFDLVELRRTEPNRAGEKGGWGGASGGRGRERYIAVLALHLPTLSSRKRRGGVGGGYGSGARGDVRRGEALAGGSGGGSVSGTRVEVGSSGLLGTVSLPAASAPLCQRASESPRISGALPFLAASAGCPLVSPLGRSLLGGLEALSVGPIPARFLLLPFEAPEMSFSISSEMNQVIRAGPIDGGGGRGRSQTANWGMARAAGVRV